MYERADDYNQRPIMRLNFGNGEHFDATPDNTAAYFYCNELMEYNHIEMDMGKTDKGKQRVMCFFVGHDNYDQMAAFMANHSYPAYINLYQLEDYVLDAYIDWCERNGQPDADILPDAIPLPPPVNDKPVAFNYVEQAALDAMKEAYEAERCRIASLPMDERSVCIRGLEAAREEWLPYHIEDYRADHMAREPRLKAKELLVPIDKLLDQLYKIDHPEEA